MVDWHSYKEIPPSGKSLILDIIGRKYEDHGFYACKDFREEDFEPDCLDMVTYLNGDDSFYQYDPKKGISLPVSNMVFWAIAPSLK